MRLRQKRAEHDFLLMGAQLREELAEVRGMKSTRTWVACAVSVVAVIIWGAGAEAQWSKSAAAGVSDWLAHPIDFILTRLEKLTSDWTPKFLEIATKLALALWGVETSYRLLMTAVRSDDALRGATAVVVKQIFRGGLVMALIQYGDSWVPAVTASLVKAGALVTGQGAVSPQSILQSGIGTFLASGEMGDGSLTELPARFVGAVFGLLLLVCYVALAAIATGTLAQVMVVQSAGCLMLGFAGASWTFSIAFSFFRYLLGSGVKLMVLNIMLAVMNDQMKGLAQILESKGTMASFEMLAVALASLILMVWLAASIPSYVAGIATGAVMGGAEDLIAAGMAGAMMRGGGLMSGGADSAAAAGGGAPGGTSSGVGGGAGSGGAAATQAAAALAAGGGGMMAPNVGGLSGGVGSEKGAAATKDGSALVGPPGVGEEGLGEGGSALGGGAEGGPASSGLAGGSGMESGVFSVSGGGVGGGSDVGSDGGGSSSSSSVSGKSESGGAVAEAGGGAVGGGGAGGADPGGEGRGSMGSAEGMASDGGNGGAWRATGSRGEAAGGAGDGEAGVSAGQSGGGGSPVAKASAVASGGVRGLEGFEDSNVGPVGDED